MGPSKEKEGLMLKKPKYTFHSGFQGRVFKGKVRERVSECLISLWTSFWLVGGEVTGWYFGSQHIILLVPTSLESVCWWSALNFFHLVHALVSAKQLKDMAQDIIYSPWGGTKGPWLCFMAKLLLFCLAWLFSFVSAFSHFSD